MMHLHLFLVNMNFVDSSDSNTEYEFFRDDVPAKSQVNATPQGLNLEAGDAITVQAATGSNTIQGDKLCFNKQRE